MKGGYLTNLLARLQNMMNVAHNTDPPSGDHSSATIAGEDAVEQTLSPLRGTASAVELAAVPSGCTAVTNSRVSSCCLLGSCWARRPEHGGPIVPHLKKLA